jgi:hypothetical protein
VKFKKDKTMDRITAKINVENAVDFVLAQQGKLPPEEVRRVELEALVDTGASLLCLPKSQIEALGLTQTARGAGPRQTAKFRAIFTVMRG